MKRVGLIVIFAFLALFSYSQKKRDQDIVEWSATNKLSASDFNFRKSDSTHNFCSASFVMEYQNSLFSLKSFNKMFQNVMLKSTSYIDTSLNVPRQLMYLQTLFDIQEIYTRHWRMAYGHQSSGSLRNTMRTEEKAMADAVERQEKYRDEIFSVKENAWDSVQKKWDDQIHIELINLREYGTEKVHY